ncbi:hypothetical protein [Mycobacteroides abscessus]|uniref:hypothetical protein n=1 Tax=Mycobacteroides abscessus TaxID=36809 RepID=UPI0009A72053|nr:hypothetical protein [Mycobacteroides abscessus]SLF27649.1 Uncharacterised protein [Mycobacteroides abscessus subsp. abscessus]SLH51728.1 Uncharacterised protein [Mycobacteroides abscessus subsp. abscessus]
MALTGDRARARGGRAAAARWVVPLTLLLTLAAALFPALRCSPALDAHVPHGAGVSVARAAAAAAQGVRAPRAPRIAVHAMHSAAAQGVDVHSGCQLPAAVLATMAAAGPGHGWWALVVAATALLAAAAAAWVPASRGPPERGQLGSLCSGRARLHHFCVLRR